MGRLRLRYKLRTFLVAITMTSVAMVWWVSRPSRMAHDFAEAVASRDERRLASICPGRDVFEEFELGGPLTTLTCQVKSRTRTLSDVIHRKGEFVVVVVFVGQTYWGQQDRTHFNIVVDKDTVIPESPRRFGPLHRPSGITPACNPPLESTT